MTRKFFLIAGVAGLALAAPAQAERGGKHDREAQSQSQSGNEQSAQRPQRAERQQVQRAERPQRMERQQFQRAERPQRMERPQFQRAERPQRMERQQVQRAERPHFERQLFQRAERPQRVERQQVQRAERQQFDRIQRAERPQRFERQRIQRAERPQRIERQQIQRAERLQRNERQRIDRIERLSAERVDNRRELARTARTDFNSRRELRQDRQAFQARFAAERPRMTALLSERQMRPMRIRDDRRVIAVGNRIDPRRYSSVIPTVYRARYYDTPDYFYRYDDDHGYLYRVERGDNIVRALIPLYGGYGIGDPWPTTYYSSYVPLGYRSYYYDTPDYYYRYDGNGIYQISAQTQLITALVALLTGQGLGIGQMLPASYSAYNVPLSYRSTYYDRDDAWYRYGDGFIYQVDPYDRRVEARYPIYGAGYDYAIGQPWPVAYPGYNVPYGYQQVYYDTPQYQYRYANGGIYQVDPTTQVIMALVALVTGQQFNVGQPLPPSYAAYNVPLAYRDRYFDSSDDWYRYANGTIYRVNPYNGLIEEAIPVYA